MGIWRIHLVLTVTVFALILGVLGSSEPAYAITTTISDQASCENNSSGDVPSGVSGSWNATAGVCTISRDFDVNATDTLTIDTGVALIIDTGFSLENRGSITNDGILNFTGDNSARSGEIDNRNGGSFTNTGTINLLGDDGNRSGRIFNRDGSAFTNSGTITLTGDSGNNSGSILNRDPGTTFTNSGTITLTGDSGTNSGRLSNSNSASFTNSGTITLTGDSGTNSGRLVNSASFTNSGSITLTGADGTRSGAVRNTSTFTNSGTITITDEGTGTNSGDVRNTGTITNTGTMSLQNGSDFNNTNGAVINDCGTITIDGVQTGNAFVETTVVCSGVGSSTPSQDPNLGDVRHGKGHDNGFCMNQYCVNVREMHTDFPPTTIPQGSTQAFTFLVHWPRGANTGNHIEIAGVLPNPGEIQWSAAVDRQPRSDIWDLTINNPFGEIGEVTVTVQQIGQSFISATFNVEFLIPGSIGTPDGIGDPQENNRHIHAQVWDNDRYSSTYIFNDGIYVDDIFAYPQVETSYEAPLEYEALCLNENPNKRYTCAFDKVKQWTIKNAEEKLKEINNEHNYKIDSEESEQK